MDHALIFLWVAVQQFNVGLHQIMIVADDTHALSQQGPGLNKEKIKSKKRKREAEIDDEFGVTRGLDFKSVCTVINLELPDTADGYVHRCSAMTDAQLISPLSIIDRFLCAIACPL